MSGILRPTFGGPGGNGHGSASQRKIAQQAAAIEHFKAVICALVHASGGAASVPREALDVEYVMHYEVGEDGGISYVVRTMAEEKLAKEAGEVVAKIVAAKEEPS